MFRLLLDNYYYFFLDFVFVMFLFDTIYLDFVSIYSKLFNCDK